MRHYGHAFGMLKSRNDFQANGEKPEKTQKTSPLKKKSPKKAKKF